MRVKTVPTLVAVVATGALITAVPFASSATAKPGKHAKATAVVRISTRSLSGLGKVLVNSQGRTLYMFVPDKRKKVTCVGGCAVAWPPLKVPAGAKFSAAGGVKASLLRMDKDPAGGKVATYNGWPLYTYVADTRPGQATGQAVNANGGLWYVLSPSGAVIKTKPSGSSSGGSGSGSGSGSGTTTTTKGGGGGGAACSDDDGDGDQSAGGPDDGDGCL